MATVTAKFPEAGNRKFPDARQGRPVQYQELVSIDQSRSSRASEQYGTYPEVPRAVGGPSDQPPGNRRLLIIFPRYDMRQEGGLALALHRYYRPKRHDLDRRPSE